jgi:hypothetical protein
MPRDIIDWLLAMFAGVVVVCLVMLLRPSRRRVSGALLVGAPVFATMGALLAGFMSAALAARLRLHYPIRMFVPHVGIYLGGIAGSLFALWITTSGPTGHSFRIKGPVGYAFLVAIIAAVTVFCWIGIPGYISLSAHQPPTGWHPNSGAPLPPDTSSEPPWYALFIAGYMASLAFVATFAVLSGLLIIAWKAVGRRNLNSTRTV